MKQKNIIVSIDDICPHDYSGLKAINTCLSLIKKYPNMKFIFFIPLAYKRISGRVEILSEKDKSIVNIINKEPLFLSKYKDYCDILKSLPENNFQFGYHGYFHSKPVNCWPRSNNNEFEELNYSETMEKINLMNKEIDESGLNGRFSKIFRPPGWKISNEAIKAFLDSGYSLHLNKETKYDFSNIENKNNIYYFDFSPPETPLENKDGDTHVVYHACEWLKNYITTEQIENLLEFNKDYKLEFMFL